MSSMSASPTKDSGPKRSGGEISEVKRDVHAIKDDLRQLKEDATQLSTHATDRAMEAVKSTAESAEDIAKNAAKSAKRYHEAMCEQVSAHPTTAILLAIGAGVIAGRILSSRR